MFQNFCSVVAGVSAAKETVAWSEEDYLSHIIGFFIVVVKMWTHVFEWHYFGYHFETVEVLGVTLQKRGPNLSLTPACVAVVVSVYTSTMLFAFCTHNATRFVFKLCAARFTRGVHSSASFTKITVEQLLKATSEYEERLRRCDAPSSPSLSRKATYNTHHPDVRLVGVNFFLITYQIIIPVMHSSYTTST